MLKVLAAVLELIYKEKLKACYVELVQILGWM